MLPNLFILHLCSHLFSVGDSAKNAFHSNPENTVFDAKRLIGRKMDDNELARNVKHFPFNVVETAGKPAIQINYKSETREFVSFASLPEPRESTKNAPCRLPKKSALWF